LGLDPRGGAGKTDSIGAIADINKNRWQDAEMSLITDRSLGVGLLLASPACVWVAAANPEACPGQGPALPGQGLRVDEAGDGRAALIRLDEEWPGLILLDLLMPGMDGFAFLGELQRRAEGRSVPVVVLTAKDLTAADYQRLGGPIEKILRKGSLGHEQLLAEVSAVMAGYSRRK